MNAFLVGDIASSLQHVRENGGAVLQESADGNHAIIRDPVGVCIALRAGE